MQSLQITSPNISVTDTAFEIRPVMPGTTYNVTVTFVNQVGESVDNTVGKSLTNRLYDYHAGFWRWMVKYIFSQNSKHMVRKGIK